MSIFITLGIFTGLIIYAVLSFVVFLRKEIMDFVYGIYLRLKKKK